jgi:hypothetical protein
MWQRMYLIAPRCPNGKYRSPPGQPFCKSVQEGLCIPYSLSLAIVEQLDQHVDQELDMPSHNDELELSNGAQAALIKQLAAGREQVGIDRKLFSPSGSPEITDREARRARSRSGARCGFRASTGYAPGPVYGPDFPPGLGFRVQRPTSN